MNTYTIPADVVLPSKVGAVVHLAVPGECSGHCGPRLDCCEVPHDPPPVLADLVGKPCETCGDTDDPGEIIWPETGCFTQHDADIVRECPVVVNGEHPTEHDGAECWHCHSGGTVSLGRWKVKALLPVIEGSPSLADGVECIIVEHEPPAILLWNDEGCDPITVLRTPEPGGYVAELELVVAP